MVFKTMTDHKLIQHEFEVSKDSYRPDALIMSAGNLTSKNCRVVLDDDGSYVQCKQTGQCLAVHKRNNIYELDVEIMDSQMQREPEATLLPIEASEQERRAAIEFGEARAVHRRKIPRVPT